MGGYSHSMKQYQSGLRAQEVCCVEIDPGIFINLPLEYSPHNETNISLRPAKSKYLWTVQVASLQEKTGWYKMIKKQRKSAKTHIIHSLYKKP